MKKVNYLLIGMAMLCFAGAIGAANDADGIVPPMQNVLAYINQAHSQDQSY